METAKASIEISDEKVQLSINLGADGLAKIPLTEDRPNEVKAAFNKIIRKLRTGEFQIELPEAKEDLFTQVSLEYLAQLNREMKEVRTEMIREGLAVAEAPTPSGTGDR